MPIDWRIYVIRNESTYHIVHICAPDLATAFAVARPQLGMTGTLKCLRSEGQGENAND